MNSHEHNENSLSHELPQNELDSLFRAVANRLMTSKSEVADAPGAIAVDSEAQAPKRFVTPLSPKVVREIFYPDDTELIMANGSDVEYTTPHRPEDPDEPNLPVCESVIVHCMSRLPDTDMARRESFVIERRDGNITGSVDVEYYREDEDKHIAISDDVPHPLTAHEGEKLRLLVDVLGVD